MSVFDDRYFATIGPQGPGNPPSPTAPSATPAAPTRLPFPAADPPIWLSPEASISSAEAGDGS